MIIYDLIALQQPTFREFETFYIRYDEATENSVNEFLTALTKCEVAGSITLFDASAECKLNADAVNTILNSATFIDLDNFEILSEHCEYDDFPATIDRNVYISKVFPKSSDEPHNRLSVQTRTERGRGLEVERPKIEAAFQLALVATPTVLEETLQKYSFVEHKNDSGETIHFLNARR